MRPEIQKGVGLVKQGVLLFKPSVSAFRTAAFSISMVMLLVSFASSQTLPNVRDWRTWPFSQMSPWNHPIGSNAQYVKIANLSQYVAGMNYDDRWTSSVVVASASDPVVHLLFAPAWGTQGTWSFLNAGGKNCGNSLDVEQTLIAASSSNLEYEANFYSTIASDDSLWELPLDYHEASLDFSPTFLLPAGACPSPDSDGLIAVYQPDGWIVDAANSVVTSDRKLLTTIASWIDARGDGTGWWNGRRASMIPSLAGLIRRGEISSGLIPHALALTLPATMLMRKAVWPAYAFDRNSNYSGSIAMGSLLAIPAGVDISKLGLSPQGMVIARAAQDYGVYVVDRGGGGISFLAELNDPEIRWDTPIPWWADIEIIKDNLQQITNNTVSAPGGGGTLRAPLAPPFFDQRIPPPLSLRFSQ